MKRTAIISILAFFVVTSLYTQAAWAQNTGIFLMDVNYDNGKFESNSLFVRTAHWPSQLSEETTYKFEVINFDDQNIYSSGFVVPRTVVLEGAPSIVLDKVNFTMVVPYFPNAKEIRIIGGSNQTLLSVNVTGFASDKSSQIKKEVFPTETLIVILIVAVAAIAVYFFIFSRKSRDAYDNLKKKWS